jgi:hypothetical protein
MYTIGAFRKKKEEPEAPPKPEPEPEQEQKVEDSPPAPVVPQKKDWVILTKKNIVDDEKSEDIKKNELLRVIRYNDREIILKRAYSEYMRENEAYMRSVYEKITTFNPIYFDKLRSSERGFIIFSRFVFSKYIFDKNNLKGLRELY